MSITLHYYYIIYFTLHYFKSSTGACLYISITNLISYTCCASLIVFNTPVAPSVNIISVKEKNTADLVLVAPSKNEQVAIFELLNFMFMFVSRR